MEEAEMATEPKDSNSTQIEAELAPPVAFTVIHSEESAAEGLESAAPSDIEGGPDQPETNSAPAPEMQEGAPAGGEEKAADSRTARDGPKAPATAFDQNFAAARDRMIALNVKVLQAFLANAETNLDFLAALPSVRSLSELIALQSKFASKQVDAMARPAAEISAMTQGAMKNALEAMRNQTANR
jgi:hypothetical protein